MERAVLLAPELDGQTTAILEEENLSVSAPTRQEALDRLRYRMERMLRGEVERITLDLPEAPRVGAGAHAGTFADVPDLPQLVKHAYAARDKANRDSL